MPQSMIIPPEWLAEAGVQNFRPPRRVYRCDDPHECVALTDIEVPWRKSGYPLDANGFGHDRMVRLLTGIRDNVSLPAIYIERGDPGQRPYRVRGRRGRQNPGNYGGLTSGFEYLDQPRAMLAQHLLWLTRHTPRQNGLTE
jgi:hypothetical protein